MNAARLARRLQEAGDDRLGWAEAIVEEVTDPSSGLVTRDYLDRRFAEFELRIEARLNQFDARLNQFDLRLAQFETRMAQFETRMAQFETKLTRSLILTQAIGFGALIAVVLFKL